MKKINKLMKGERKKQNKKVQRVEIECIFREWNRSRAFTTSCNYEACNMLANKLDRRGIKKQKGKLIFEFEATQK